jgi:crossover junction endodeoxyribonuclease RusA
MKLMLPYPPSANHYWRKWNNRMVISREGREYRDEVCALLSSAGGGSIRKPPSNGRIALKMDAFPPDRRRRDLDNLQKPLLDALQHAGVYEDDSQVDLLLSCRRERREGGQIVVTVSDLPLRICPLCGHHLPAESSN